MIGGGLLYIYSGAYNVSATESHTRVGQWLLETVKTESIQAHAEPVTATVTPDSVMIQDGFHSFREMCVVCHGAPGVEPGWMGQGMRPDPPRLSQAVTKYSQGELRWILRNGIKMAGMPALAPTHSDRQIESLVAFIQRLPDISPKEYEALNQTAQQEGQDGSAGHTHDNGH